MSSKSLRARERPDLLGSGAEPTVIWGIPDYAWYSHGDAGESFAPHHRYAVVMLIDQEYETRVSSCAGRYARLEV
ncbi:MAG: hypothetical protein OEQ25_10600, partial [Gammaproteobacteria bacterium]|nr:hypothetical protein [Gammaproteobacteria bacterium]